jgi:uncharacterized membrane protein YdbT with pleckstrin-like domain
MFRARPLTCLLTWIVFLGGVAGGVVMLSSNVVAGGVLIGVGVVGALVLIWWWMSTFENRLEVTNKRVIATRGIFGRATSEVPHETIQNIQVTQTFVQRLMNIGTIGVSSAGQADVEIVFRNAPNPYRIREVIDAYRNAMN